MGKPGVAGPAGAAGKDGAPGQHGVPGNPGQPGKDLLRCSHADFYDLHTGASLSAVPQALTARQDSQAHPEHMAAQGSPGFQARTAPQSPPIPSSTHQITCAGSNHGQSNFFFAVLQALTERRVCPAHPGSTDLPDHQAAQARTGPFPCRDRRVVMSRLVPTLLFGMQRPPIAHARTAPARAHTTATLTSTRPHKCMQHTSQRQCEGFDAVHCMRMHRGKYLCGEE
jgi:hypothetical protein